MDPLSGTNPTNNPRVDLLHGGGDNQQLSGAAGSYGPEPAAAPPPPPPPPAPRPQPQPSVAPKSASSYVAKAAAKVPTTPVEVPKPVAPVPEPRQAPPVPSQQPEKSGRGKAVGIGLLILIILIAAGGAGYYFLTHQPAGKPKATPPSVAVQPVAPTDLTQQAGSSSLAAGKTTNKSTVTLTFTAPTSATSGSLTPEVELEPVGTAFTGQSTSTGTAVTANGSNLQLSVSVTGLKDGTYHWQARDTQGSQHSSWVIFGGDASAAAFTVSTTAPAAPTVSSVGGVPVANPTVVTSNQPVIAGTTVPGASVTVLIGPDNQSFTATADSSGNWSVTPSASIPNGQHTVSVTVTDTAGNTSAPTQVALTINPATVAQTTPTTGATGAAAQPSTPAGSSHLAQTGDDTDAVSGAALLAMVTAIAMLIWMRRRYAFR